VNIDIVALIGSCVQNDTKLCTSSSQAEINRPRRNTTENRGSIGHVGTRKKGSIGHVGTQRRYIVETKSDYILKGKRSEQQGREGNTKENLATAAPKKSRNRPKCNQVQPDRDGTEWNRPRWSDKFKSSKQRIFAQVDRRGKICLPKNGAYVCT
jgi:hypothetical protein